MAILDQQEQIGISPTPKEMPKAPELGLNYQEQGMKDISDYTQRMMAGHKPGELSYQEQGMKDISDYTSKMMFGVSPTQQQITLPKTLEPYRDIFDSLAQDMGKEKKRPAFQIPFGDESVTKRKRKGSIWG